MSALFSVTSSGCCLTSASGCTPGSATISPAQQQQLVAVAVPQLFSFTVGEVSQLYAFALLAGGLLQLHTLVYTSKDASCSCSIDLRRTQFPFCSLHTVQELTVCIMQALRQTRGAMAPAALLCWRLASRMQALLWASLSPPRLPRRR